MHAASNNPGPSGLMASAEAGAVVAVEVFIEQDEIPPMRILLKLPCSPVNRPPLVLVVEKDVVRPVRKLLSDLIQCHLPARASGTFHPEIIPIIDVILQQSTDDQAVNGHPDGSTPVGIATEHSRVRLRRQIVHPVFLATDAKYIGMLGV